MRKGLFLLIIVAIVIVSGCKGEKSVEMGPVETVEAFYKAVTSGEWAEAEALCDTLTMKEYLDEYQQTWEMLKEENSDAMTVAQTLFGDADLKAESVKREEDKRIVTYTISADGLSKTKKAILKKVEGAWSVERIQDAN